MSLRLIEIVIPSHAVDAIDELSGAEDICDRWRYPLADDQVLIRVLIRADQAEPLLDSLESRFSGTEGFRVMLLAVEATLPRLKEEELEEESENNKKSKARISREELYNDVVGAARISQVFIAQVILSTLVAAVGLMRNDTAVLIGAMVIAPLLGPNVSLCLATTLGDKDLAIRSLKANLVGLGLALSVSATIGFIFEIDPLSPAIASRTNVSVGDIILALAAGCAGGVAFTTGVPASLIGVMVAVALLPPTAAFGMLLASGEFTASADALMLVATNIVCVNLSGVVTFYAQGVRPRTWWEEAKAKKARIVALAIWTTLLAILFLVIFFASRH